MPCLLVLIGLLLPRLALVLLFLFTRVFSVVFNNAILPILGFIFLPYTTLAYMGAIFYNGSVSGLWLILVIIAAIVDVGHWAGGHGQYGRRRRSR
jgi:hypothetical protein